MARRRSISTKISTDTAVNRLAMEYGDFAALLYTWLIPHADDDAMLTGDPEELLFMVCPGRRDKSPEDIVGALAGMHALGLLTWDRDRKVIAFPGSFYVYQSYIKVSQRRTEPTGGEERKSAENAGVSGESAANAGKHRKTPENPVLLNVSSSLSVSSPPPPSAPLPAADAAEEPRKPSITTKPAGGSGGTYVATLNGAFDRLQPRFSAIDKELDGIWLRKALVDIERDVGPLPREQLIRGLDLGLAQVKRSIETTTVSSPRPYARKILNDYLQEQADATTSNSG